MQGPRVSDQVSYPRSAMCNKISGNEDWTKHFLALFKEIPKRTTERLNAQPATPPSSPSLLAVGRLLSVQPTLRDHEHDTKLVEAQLLDLDAIKLRFLNVATAVDISASYEDACSNTSV